MVLVSIQTARQNRKRLSVSPVDSLSKVEGLRNRRGKTSIEAAMELKAKRETLTVNTFYFLYTVSVNQGVNCQQYPCITWN